jgi:hypothetical protein
MLPFVGNHRGNMPKGIPSCIDSIYLHKVTVWESANQVWGMVSATSGLYPSIVSHLKSIPGETMQRSLRFLDGVYIETKYGKTGFQRTINPATK